MAPTVHKPVHAKTKEQNVTKLYQLFLQQKFISVVSLMNKLILSMIIMKKLDLFIQKYSLIICDTFGNKVANFTHFPTFVENLSFRFFRNKK